MSSVVSGFSVGFSDAASSLEELSDKVETEPDSSSEMIVCVWSEELPVTCVLSESVTAGRETSVFSSQESVREPVSVEAGTNSLCRETLSDYE